MKLRNIILIIIIIFLIYLIYFTYICKNKENHIIDEFINGYWISDNNFAKISDIDDMILNFDIKNSSGFLIVIIDKEINDSDEFILKIHKCENNEFEIEFLSDDENFIWYDKKFKAILSINEGSLKLYHNDTLYADLFKDNKMTHLLK